MDNERAQLRFKRKLAAWIHDPAEKALVLMRDPSGHEGGTVRFLKEKLNLEDRSWFNATADHWASASDRPQFPNSPRENGFMRTISVIFSKDPVIKHPISGEEFDLLNLESIDIGEMKAASFDHFEKLIRTGKDGIDYEGSFLAFWRFGPVSPHEGLAGLWSVLPADTRVPDHSIWSHLDLTSAFGTAMDSDPALFELAIGPVQSFIKQSRSTADLWSGSHLLASLSFRAMSVVIDRYGPDSVLFPSLRGQPLMDLWLLRRAQKISEEEFSWWKDKLSGALGRGQSDSSPLYSASLPNKFVALVPFDEVEGLAKDIKDDLRTYVLELGMKGAKKLFQSAYDRHMQVQINRQMAEFPEMTWSTTRWPGKRESMSEASGMLKELLGEFLGDSDRDNVQMFSKPAWKVLERVGELPEPDFFYRANPGVLFPAVLGVVQALQASSKSERLFSGSTERDFRCSTCGDREWLCTEQEALAYEKHWPSPGIGRSESIWTMLARKRPHLAKKKSGEYLCALCSLKRSWPLLFNDEIKHLLGLKMRRYIVSTHAMAATMTLIKNLENLREVEDRSNDSDDENSEEDALLPALPPKLYIEARKLGQVNELQEQLTELEDYQGVQESKATGESYYGLLKMDGDSMGRLLQSGHERKYIDSWHPKVRKSAENVAEEVPSLREYLDSRRLVSPAFQRSVSEALGNFSTFMVRKILERYLYGKVVYAGGDDLLAFIPTIDICSSLGMLRQGFSGQSTLGGVNYFEKVDMKVGGGFCWDNDSRSTGVPLRILLGSEVATASFGVVIAHAKAPLPAVLSQVDRAEGLAKSMGRNGFCISIMKRSGGDVGIFGSFGSQSSSEILSPLLTLDRLIGLFSDEYSRRAAYIASTWLASLPPLNSGSSDQSEWEEMVVSMLRYQFERQMKDPDGIMSEQADKVIRSLVVNAVNGMLRPIDAQSSDAVMSSEAKAISSVLSVAEFLARSKRKVS